jgi:NAD(P)-dependent dehydrogenase (short-subunit alcohol dehydrogenase family)
MDKKICLITGANAGIGKAAAIQLAAKGCHVILACRDMGRGLKALEEVKSAGNSDSVELMTVDMSLQSSIRQMAAAFKHERLDVLINNAAAFDVSQRQAVKTEEGIESIWATNHIGPVLMISLFLDRLRHSDQGRVLTVASQGLMMHPFLRVDLNDPEYENSKFSVPKAYYQSKLAQVMYTYWLAENLKNTNITANCIRVTNVKIDLARYPNISRLERWAYSIKSKNSITPEQMAQTYAYLAMSPDASKVSGKYFDHHSKQVASSKYSGDKDQIVRVMELTMKYIIQA